MRWLWLWKDTALSPSGVPMEQPAFLAPDAPASDEGQEASAPRWGSLLGPGIGSRGRGPKPRPRRPRRKPRRRAAEKVAIIAASYMVMGKTWR